MRRPQHTSQHGWTLLELLLVLICVVGLAAILLYSFVTPTDRQASMRAVVSQVSQLVDAAHLWRHDHNNYAGISIDELKNSALISTELNTDKIPNHYQISSFTSSTWPACIHANSCMQITISNIPKACQYVVTLDKSGSITTFPSADTCLNNPNINLTSFSVVYG